MALLRKMDAFVKPRDDLRSRSALGGLITLVAASAASILFLAQVWLYLAGATRHSLHLSPSISVPVPLLSDLHQRRRQRVEGKIPLKVHITFAHVPCKDLDVIHDGASLLNNALEEIHGRDAVTMRSPTMLELESMLGKNEARNHRSGGCTVVGNLNIAKVGGTFSVTISRQAWSEATAFLMFGGFNRRHRGSADMPKLFNVSHYVHDVSFGDVFPLTANPLEKASHIIMNESGGVALANINVKLIPTLYQRFLSSKEMYQLSVTQHIVQPDALVAQGSAHLPGLAMIYDFTPLAVHHVESRDNVLVFISSLVGIVGGVFVTVGLVTGCLVHSAAAVAKKKD